MALEHNRTPDESRGGGIPTAPPPGAPGPGERSGRGPSFSLSQRFSVGVNVAVMVIAAAALLLLVNWIAKREFYQGDWSSLGRYSVSELTAKIAARIDEPIQITILYDSQDPEKSRAQYQPRVYELASGLRQINPKVTVTDISTPAGREALAARIQRRQGASGVEYAQLIDDFRRRQDAWGRQLAEERTRLAGLANNPKAWVHNFRQLQQAIASLGAAADELEDAAGVIQRQSTELIPDYDKQVEAIRKFVRENLDELKAVRRDVADLADLDRKITEDQGGGAIAGTRELAGQVDQAFAALLSRLPGGAAATQPDDDPLGQFRQAAAGLREISKLLEAEARLLEQFIKDQPAAGGMVGWPVRMSMQGLPMRVPRERFFRVHAGQLAQMADDFELGVPQLNIETIRQALPEMVEQVAYERDQARQLFTETEAVLVAMGGADPASRSLLDQGGEYLAELIGPLEDLNGRLDKLPELTGGGLAEQLKQDNLVLVEVGEKDPRVLTFEEVWPEVGAFELPPGMDVGKREKQRTFNGDSAVGSALFALSRSPVAEVVFVHYSQMPGHPMMMQQQDEGELPMSQLTELRDRLEKANLKVSTWNLAMEMEPPPPAYADEPSGQEPSATTQPEQAEPRTPLTRVYVVLPPAPPAPPSPYGGQQPESFGPHHEAMLAEALEDGGRALFLCGWSLPRYNPQAGALMQSPYAWEEYLSETWGLNVESGFRINWGVRTGEEGKLRLNEEEINWMPLNTFNTRNPIGRPLANRRVLLLNACPIERSDPAPEGIVYETVLGVSHGSANYFATHEFGRLVDAFRRTLPFEVKDSDKTPPLDVMVQAERQPGREGQTEKSRLVVFAAGMSLADYYMGQPVRRRSEAGDFNEPPPTTNAEIAVNAVYWLAGQEEWIAAGPITIPPIRLEQDKLRPIQAMVVGAAPLLVLLIGGAVALWRRKF